MADALVSFFFGDGSKFEIVDIEFKADAIISEKHEYANDVTENPVEKGAPINDHVQTKPAKLSIEGIVSDTPIKFFGGQSFETITGQKETDSRSKDAFNSLENLLRSREIVRIVTAYKTYDDMVCETLSIPRTKDTVGALFFSASFKQVRIVKPESTVITVQTPQKKMDTGKQEKKNPADKIKQRAAEKLKKDASILGNLFGRAQ